IEARLAPTRSCITADCLRSTQVRSPPRFRTNPMTNATRANAIPRSAASAPLIALPLSRPRPASPGRLRDRAGDRRALIAEPGVREPRERRDPLGQLAEQLLGPPRPPVVAERPRDRGEDLPVGPGLAAREDRAPEPLDPAVDVRERALALDVRRARQHAVRPGAGPVGVRPLVDEAVDPAERLGDEVGRPPAVEHVVADHPEE